MQLSPSRSSCMRNRAADRPGDASGGPSRFASPQELLVQQRQRFENYLSAPEENRSFIQLHSSPHFFTNTSCSIAMADTRQVSTVRVVVHTMGAMAPGVAMSNNHWSIYLVLHNSLSMRLNMTAEEGYVTGNLNITEHQYATTQSAIQCFDYVAAPGVTVQHFVGLIYQYRRQLYDMSGGGSGCRYWM